MHKRWPSFSSRKKRKKERENIGRRLLALPCSYLLLALSLCAVVKGGCGSQRAASISSFYVASSMVAAEVLTSEQIWGGW
jgi:hypothetical protein